MESFWYQMESSWDQILKPLKKLKENNFYQIEFVMLLLSNKVIEQKFINIYLCIDEYSGVNVNESLFSFLI